MIKRLLNKAKAVISGMPSDAAGNLEAISLRAESALGKVTQVLHEIHSPDLHVDVLHFAPCTGRDFHYLITSGMSDRAMTDNGVAIDEPFWELTIALPSHWQVNASASKDPALWEPIRLLKELAHYPNWRRTYFAKYHTVGVEDRPLMRPMAAVLFMPPVLVQELRDPVPMGRDREVQFMSLYLLHLDELELKSAGNLDLLFDRFAEREFSELYNLSRPSVLL